MGITRYIFPVLRIVWISTAEDAGDLMGDHVEGLLLARGQQVPVMSGMNCNLQTLGILAHSFHSTVLPVSVGDVHNHRNGIETDPPTV